MFFGASVCLSVCPVGPDQRKKQLNMGKALDHIGVQK